MSVRFSIVAAMTVVLGFSAGALAGCQHERGPLTLASLSGFGLHLVDEGDHMKLAYGQSNSDNIGLMLECAKGSRRIAVSDLQRRGDDRVIRLASGEARSELRGEVQEFEGVKLLLANARPSEAALEGFRKTGKLNVANGGVSYAVTASASEQTAVERFFSACNRA
jgi:hypothetical protein